jgi:LacI family transcriptional regulator
MAGEYFRDKGYGASLFLGRDLRYANEILDGYRTTFPGQIASLYLKGSSWDRSEEADLVMKTLNQMHKPTAIFCDNDWQACYVIRLVNKHNWRVPRDCSILGSGDDEMAQLQSHIPISSVDMNWKQIGVQVGQLIIDKLLRGETASQSIRIPPARIITRRSSEHFATEDPHLLRAVQLIDRQACNNLKISDVVAASGLSRRTLERRFQNVFKRGIDAEIRRRKIAESAKLLRTTTLSIGEIAERCGFSSQFYFSSSFKTRHGVSPRAYRDARKNGTSKG